MRELLVFLASVCLVGTVAGSCSAPATKNERFFGLHCDFHASPADTVPIGSTLSKADIREICRILQPDFIQVDCKGHPGWASYPSAIGNSMPRIQGNPLRVWRDVTKSEGVDLYVHYSGVYDCRYAGLHPDDAVKKEDGTPESRYLRTNGNYADSLLIPQLLELAGEYGIDGAWVDGENWAAALDYDPRTLKAFQEETDIDLGGSLPVKGTPYYDAFRDYCRELFRRYLRHYTAAVHKQFPGFKICSNWAFSDHMPEAPSAPVDFLSGDIFTSIEYARYAVRAIEKQGLPWDLMTWGFRKEGKVKFYKEPIELMQEAAEVISFGGGFSVYFTQLRDGSPDVAKIRNIAPLAEFVHERKAWTFGGHPVKEVAVLLSTHEHYLESSGLFLRNGSESTQDAVNVLCKAGISTVIASEHDLSDGKASDYSVIVVPPLKHELPSATKDILNKFEDNGGTLVWCKTEGMDGLAQTVAGLYEPAVRLEASSGPVEIVNLVKDGITMVQLINAGRYDSPVSDIQVSVRCEKRPSSIFLQPSGEKLQFDWRDNRAYVTVPRLEIHSVLVIESE